MRVKIKKPKDDLSYADRISVRIDPYDTWDMAHTLAYIIHPMLVQLKATKHGSPYSDFSDVPPNLRSADLLHDRWKYILDEMIWAFNYEITSDYEIDAAKEERKENGFRLFGKYYAALWD